MNEKEQGVAFGQRVRAARHARGWTQWDLAKTANISSKFLSRVETGHVSPSLFVAFRLAQALGRSLDELAGHRVRRETEDLRFSGFAALLRGRSAAQLEQAKRVLQALFGKAGS